MFMAANYKRTRSLTKNHVVGAIESYFFNIKFGAMILYFLIWLVKYCPKRAKYFSDSLEYDTARDIGFYIILSKCMLLSNMILTMMFPGKFFDIILMTTVFLISLDLNILFNDLCSCKFNLRNFKPTNITIAFGFEGNVRMPVI